MDVTPLVKQGQSIIQSYSGGRFRISGEVFEGAVVVTPDAVHGWDYDGAVADLSIADFETILPQLKDADVVLMGCGAQMEFLPKDVRVALRERGISIDTMDTGAACRTFNVLIAEGRRVTSVLLPV